MMNREHAPQEEIMKTLGAIDAEVEESQAVKASEIAAKESEDAAQKAAEAKISDMLETINAEVDNSQEMKAAEAAVRRDEEEEKIRKQIASS